MQAELNWIAILAATVICFIVGAVWYGFLFAKQWMKYANLSKDGDKNTPYGVFLIPPTAALISTIIIAHTGYITHVFYGINFLTATLTSAIILWLGFSFTTLVVNNVFESRPWQLLVINSGYTLVLAIAAGLTIGLVGV
jgi:hypothetical protein